MELDEAIKGRRSVRKFKDRPVGRQQLLQLVEAAIWAPSGGNRQAWHFVVVTNPEKVRRMCTVSPGIFGDPPSIIAVCKDLARVEERAGASGDALATIDAAMATENLLLAAHNAGLGGCVIASFHKRAVAQVLSLPEKVVPVLLVSLGWPDEFPAPPARRRDVVSLDEYEHAEQL